MEMELTFTSFRDSVSLDGLKVSLDQHVPRLCSYPIMGFMLLPNTRSLSVVNTERVCNVVLDNNWELIKDFIDEIHDLGINRVVFCDWATKEQIAHGKWCPAGIIGNYIKTRTEEFGYTVTITMLDGRDVL